VDTIACLSVNDPFVMGAWAKATDGAEDILMLADGSGDFTRELGLTLDAVASAWASARSAIRCWSRTASSTELNIEAGGEFKVSSAEHLLAQL
jgi:peroxiredoxin